MIEVRLMSNSASNLPDIVMAASLVTASPLAAPALSTAVFKNSPMLMNSQTYWIAAFAPSVTQSEWLSNNQGAIGSASQISIFPWRSGPAVPQPAVRINGTPKVQSLSVAGLRNFDVVSPGDMEVNDFHITLHGITDPLLEANGGTQIQSTFPASFNTPNPNPSGWYPPVINTILTPPPPRTVVTYGGPGAQFVGGSTKMHFGVSLTPAGEAALGEICMTWTVDGVPVSAGGTPSLPITIIPDQVAPGETKVQLVNQICPEEMTEGFQRWLGPIHMSILDRHVELDELLADSPIIVEAGVLFDGNTLLAPGEQITFSNIDAASPVAAGKSIVVWYDVFEDDGRSLGRWSEHPIARSMSLPCRSPLVWC